MSLPDILRQIIAHKREELDRLPAEMSLRDAQAGALDAPPARDFAGALRGDDVRVIAEIKRASPSAGTIRGGEFDPAAIARGYEQSGAAALSVLTDERFFGGHLDHLRAARAAVAIPVLRQDFVIAARQVYAARGAGADGVLLIVAALEPDRLAALLALAHELGMAALIEAHEEGEVEAALAAGARVVGVNNRDLRTFEVDLATTERLAAMVPDDRVLVAESGVHTREDVERLAGAGADGVLVGTALMRADDPGEALGALTGVKAKRR